MGGDQRVAVCRGGQGERDRGAGLARRIGRAAGGWAGGRAQGRERAGLESLGCAHRESYTGPAATAARCRLPRRPRAGSAGTRALCGARRPGWWRHTRAGMPRRRAACARKLLRVGRGLGSRGYGSGAPTPWSRASAYPRPRPRTGAAPSARRAAPSPSRPCPPGG